MRLPALAAVAVALAGCIAAPGPPPAPALDPAAPAAILHDDHPFVLEWKGNILSGRLENPSHGRPAEDALWPVQKVGFLLDLPQAPTAMEVALSWEGSGAWLIMLHPHKAEGTNTYVEHITKMSEEQPQCLRVPPGDLTTGHWQVMVHADEDAGPGTFTLTVRTWGVEGSVVEDDRHGHWRQDGAFEVDEHDILPCADAAP